MHGKSDREARVDIAPMLAEADAFRSSGDHRSAVAAYLRAHGANPTRIYPLFWLATLLEDLGDLGNARGYCEQGLLLDGSDIGLLLRLGSIATKQEDFVRALETYEHVAGLDPDVPSLDALIADQCCHLGRICEGVAAFERAIVRAPEEVVLQSNRLFVLNYGNLLSPEALAREHFSWGARLERTLQEPWPMAPHSLEPQDSFRIGYVSSDLREHAVATFVEPLLQAHDHSRFEIHCFDTSLLEEDSCTKRMRMAVPAWHRVGHLSDEDLASHIRRTGIDLLIDLAGHTKGNRLPAFARKPAPIQATWLGYLNTTGLRAVDYRITDAHLDPPGMTEALHTERLIRLRTHACFMPAQESPPVAPSPAHAGNPLTFGSVNQWPKVSDAAKELWCQMLAQAQDARLFLVVRGAQHASVRERIFQEFLLRGTRKEQIHVFPFMSRIAFLEMLGHIDVALDTFPYGGGTTTMQCLHAGVPVVTLAGRTAMSRNSVGMLHSVGLSDLIAATPAEYVNTAISLGRDTRRLAQLRTELRTRLAASSLTDAPAFARDLELAILAMCNKDGSRRPPGRFS